MWSLLPGMGSCPMEARLTAWSFAMLFRHRGQTLPLQLRANFITVPFAMLQAWHLTSLSHIDMLCGQDKVTVGHFLWSYSLIEKQSLGETVTAFLFADYAQ